MNPNAIRQRINQSTGVSRQATARRVSGNLRTAMRRVSRGGQGG